MGCTLSSKVCATRRSPGPKTVLPAALQNAEDIRDKYQLGGVLGSGSFGQVREAVLKASPESEKRAVKMIERDDDDGEWGSEAIFVREVTLLQQMKHENIIRYYDVYEDMHFLYVVMELCKGGEVFGKIAKLKQLSENNAADLGRQMLRAIAYIHDLRICHRDVKAENFMLAEDSLASSVKMIDFGLACKCAKGEVLRQLCGSPQYLAPELIRKKYDLRVDVWALGVLLYLLMYGRYPFDAKGHDDTMMLILTAPIEWKTKAKLSDHALGLLRRLLERDVNRRLTAAQALEHPWLRPTEAEAEKGRPGALPVEVIRSAHKTATLSRKQVDPQVEESRNAKLRKLDEDFRIGIRYGMRVGESPAEEFMSRPEFVRRENKTSTAPSQPPAEGKRRRRRASWISLRPLQKIAPGKPAGGPGPEHGSSLPYLMPAESEEEARVATRSQPTLSEFRHQQPVGVFPEPTQLPGCPR